MRHTRLEAAENSAEKGGFFARLCPTVRFKDLTGKWGGLRDEPYTYGHMGEF